MNTKAMRWVLSSGLVTTGLSGCADPCSDDGLVQSDPSECPVDSSDGSSGETEAGTETVTSGEAESDSDADTLETDSNSGGTESETDSDAKNFFIVLGDFNIVDKDHGTMEALESNGFKVPTALKRVPGTNVDKCVDGTCVCSGDMACTGFTIHPGTTLACVPQ